MDGQRTGIVPANYLRVLGKRRGTGHSSSRQPLKPNDTVATTSDTLQRYSHPGQDSVTSSKDDPWSFDDVS